MDLFPSSGDRRMPPTLLGPLERGNLGYEHEWGTCSIFPVLPAPSDGRVYSAFNINGYQIEIENMFLGGRARSVLEADNLIAMREPIV
jgi:hypothetical protein